MYVAAPVRDQGKIIGVLSVGKPNVAMAPVIHRSERRILWAGGALLGIALLIGLVVAGWINRSIGTLSRYAENDIEHYVHALTHELKSPIAAIRGAAEILTEQPPPQVAARFIDNILVQNARMQSLVEKLLTQARLENRVEIVPANVSVNTLFTRLADTRAALLAAKNITLICDNTSLSVAGDPDLLEQALGNLLDNAIDFTPPGGVISLIAREAQKQVQLIVTDSGNGIPDYALARVFERFYSLPRDNGLKSSGLGLAFVQEVARLHQGEITLHNREEGGAIATLTLHPHFT